MFYPQFTKTVGTIPDDITITDWIFENRAKNGLETAFIDSLTGEHRSWKVVESTTRQLARGLTKLLGVKVGDDAVFGLFAPNVGVLGQFGGSH